MACLLAAVCLSVFAARKPPAKERVSIDYSKAIAPLITDERLTEIQKSIVLHRLLLVPLSDPTCPLQSGGVCPIEIPVLLLPDPADTTKFYCVAVFPEVVVLPGSTVTNPSEKIIVWALKPASPPPPGTTFTFYDEKNHGIILLKNGSTQLHHGALGDGTLPLDPTKYMFRSKNNVSKAEAVYLPIVVRTDDAGKPSEKVSVCGTPDPRIQND
jgi:hypothetical protein